MARKIPVNKDGVPIGWWNKLVMTGEEDLLIFLMIDVGIVVAAIVLYALLG